MEAAPFVRVHDQRHCYDYPRPALTVDIVLFRRTPALQVLLIRRDSEPFAGTWAFPGGFVDENEPLEHAAERELNEETAIEGVKLRQFGAFGDPGRDPRGHTVRIAFTGEVGKELKPQRVMTLLRCGGFPWIGCRS